MILKQDENRMNGPITTQSLNCQYLEQSSHCVLNHRKYLGSLQSYTEWSRQWLVNWYGLRPVFAQENDVCNFHA